MTDCFHCGLKVTVSTELTLELDGTTKSFCCYGCLAVAEVISAGGLEGYYRYRDSLASRPAEPANTRLSLFQSYDLNEVQQQFVSSDDSGFCTARLQVQGISCAACAWLIEHHLEAVDGVMSVRVNVTTRQVLLKWDPARQLLSHLFMALARIGYDPQPERPDLQNQLRRTEAQQSLLRLGVAGIGMMQVGMVAVALYAGALQGMSDTWLVLLRWVSFLVATPVVFFSASPFFKSAWRAVKAKHLNMDVPVSIAIALAYSVSAWATISRSGDVYFDSVSMFTFFLLLGRYLEMRARHSNIFASENLRQLLPLSVQRLDEVSSEESLDDGNVVDINSAKRTAHCIPLSAVKPGDVIYLAAGEVVPADGELISELAYLDESLLTGESLQQQKQSGDFLAAGTLNCATSIEFRVVAVGDATQLAAVEQLVEQAALQKPRRQAIADRIAGHFVAAVLIIASLTGAAWWWLEPARALWVVLSVLVVTCPCALSLATPTALTAGLSRARRLGLLVANADSLENLNQVQHVAFDKTGTLTCGELRIVGWRLFGTTEASAEQVDYWLDIIAALESHTRHPIAAAFVGREQCYSAKQVEVVEGEGVGGRVNHADYRFGRMAYVLDSKTGEAPTAEGLWQLLAIKRDAVFEPILWVEFADEIRSSASAAVTELQAMGKTVSVVSGDRRTVVKVIAGQLGIANIYSEQRPQDKLQWLQQHQQAGDNILMVGDGINDVPVLSGANVSMAMGAATKLAQASADCILLNGNLGVIPAAMTLSQRVRKVIRQNLAWALIYNGVALPLAVTGVLPPYLAAVGMSFSSLIVVVNAMRL
ncbi:heavy metal translocating P-type ATPase [Teredinibacter waterburyi]|uniref:heavy metal translocating P-type ATPase n=1 Tax=Teredinibacter waterburyi TaxID=1500538 RepID=UPI00165F1A97|nr:heavy metal translocating P-type ATPase [Teredinibacter waterburyi]